MTDTTVGSPAPRKRRAWLRAIAWVFGVLIVLLVAVYLVATSGAFFKGVILPRVSTAMNAEVTVSDASISPFKQVVLHNLKVQTTGAEPLVTAAEVRLRYSLMAILGGNIRVDEIALSSPTVVLVENADGSSNLDPILKAQQAKPAEKETEPAAKPPAAKPPQIDLKKLALTDATFRRVKNYANGTRDVAELSHVNVTLDDLKNGQTGKLALNADIRVENTNGVLQAKLSGDFAFALTADLKPASIKGNTRLDVSRAEGALADFAAFGSELEVEVTPTDIKTAALRFKKGDTRLGELRVSGPFDMEKTEGRLSIVLAGIDKRLLNLAGASSGMDFGGTTIGSTNEIELAKGGSLITANGQSDINNFQVTRTNQTTPRLDLRKEYSVTVDRGQSLATLRRLTLTGTQNGKPLLKADLTSPMQIAWGSVSNALGDATLTMAVSDLDLADWKPFLGEVAPAGMANLTAKVLSQQGGRQVTLDFDSRIDRLTVNAGSNHISDATITLRASAKATDLKQFNLADSKLEVARQNETLTTISGSGTYDTTTEAADMQFAAQATLAPLLRALPQPDMSGSSGTLDLKAHLTQKQKTQTVIGKLALADFTGRSGNNQFHSFGAAADFDVEVTPQKVQIRKVSGKLTEAGKAGGSFDLSGSFDPATKSVELTAKVADLNENGLRPFLEPMLADKQLVSIAINANATAQHDPQGASAVKAAFQMANLVVKDPTGQFPATPLDAKMQVDVSLKKQVADVRQFQVTLTPTARATNQVQLSGQVDMSQTNAIQGNLKLVADSLDVTSYYDLFMGEKPAPDRGPATATSQAARTPAPAPPDANKEPEAIKFPLRNFTAEAAIGRFYLHEVEIADWQTTAKIDGGHVVVNPFKLMLNGAPVNTTLDLDLGVPGWKYDLSLSAQAIPLAPLVNSFQPDRKGILSGTMTAQAKLGGAGTTGASLQKNLTGQFDMASTNLNLSVDNIQGKTFYTRLLKTLVKAIVVIPELAKNPGSTATSLLQGLTGSGSSSSSGGTADLAKSPINAIILRGTAGSGRVDLQKAMVQSPAFEAQASGTITLAEVLTNSPIQIPVSISLQRSVAQRINMAGNTPTNAIYAKLPDFLTMKGTLGNSKADINKVALTSAVLQGMGGKAGQAGGALQGLSSLLSRGTNATSNATTNQSGGKAGGLLQGIEGLLGNSPPGATNAPATNQAPVDSLIKGLFRPKKK
jgi:uncharacterized protein involved in outer membrane biogenesis